MESVSYFMLSFDRLTPYEGVADDRVMELEDLTINHALRDPKVNCGWIFSEASQYQPSNLSVIRD